MLEGVHALFQGLADMQDLQEPALRFEDVMDAGAAQLLGDGAPLGEGSPFGATVGDDASGGASLSPNGFTAGETDACSVLEDALKGVSWDAPFGQAPGVGDDLLPCLDDEPGESFSGAAGKRRLNLDDAALSDHFDDILRDDFKMDRFVEEFGAPLTAPAAAGKRKRLKLEPGCGAAQGRQGKGTARAQSPPGEPGPKSPRLTPLQLAAQNLEAIPSAPLRPPGIGTTVAGKVESAPDGRLILRRGPRRKYTCTRCGAPKEGHVCEVVETRAIDTQVDLEVTRGTGSLPQYHQRILSVNPKKWQVQVPNHVNSTLEYQQKQCAQQYFLNPAPRMVASA
jgi:hypothetical protein